MLQSSRHRHQPCAVEADIRVRSDQRGGRFGDRVGQTRGRLEHERGLFGRSEPQPLHRRRRIELEGARVGAVSGMTVPLWRREVEEVERSAPVAERVVPAAGGNEIDNLAQTYLSVIGGASNVTDVDACISRLRLSLIDGSKVDEVAARHAGANGVIRLNNQSVQIIIGPKAELVAAAMQKLLGK